MTAELELQRSAAAVNAKRVEAFDCFLQTWGYAKNTRLTYVNFARRFSDFIGAKNLAEVTANDVSQFRLFLFNQGFSSTSQATAFFAVRKLYKVLRMADVVTWSPPHALPTRKVHKRLPKLLTEKQVKQLIAAATSPRDAALLEFLYATGCRPAEVANMTVQDVLLQSCTATVRDGKDGDRVVCFGRFALRSLTKYLNGRVSGPLFLPDPKKQKGSLRFIDGYRRTYWVAFWREWKEMCDGRIVRVPRRSFLGRLKELPTREHAETALKVFLEKRLQDPEQRILGTFAQKPEKPLTTRNIQRIIKQIALRAGLGSAVTPYRLRHSFATHCLHHGMELRYVQHLMGHEHAGTTQVYLHSTPDELIAVHRKFFPRR